MAAVDGRGAVVGCDGDDVAAVVAGLGDVVVERDGAVGRVVGPDQQQLGVKPVVVAVRRVEASECNVEARIEVVDLGLDVGGGDAQAVENGAGQDHRLRAALARRADAHDRLGARLLDGVQHGVGDLGQGFVPGDALELALAALTGAPQRMKHALLPVEHLAPGGTLLAAGGVHVGDALFHRLEVAGGLLADDAAVPDVDAVGAVGGVAVDAVAAPGDLVPLPLVSIRVCPGAVLGTGSSLFCSHQSPLFRRGSASASEEDRRAGKKSRWRVGGRPPRGL